MVHSVVAVPNAGKMKREHYNPAYTGVSENSSNGSFAQALEHATEEVQNSLMDCVTTTYGRDRMMRTFYYQPREYHF